MRDASPDFGDALPGRFESLRAEIAGFRPREPHHRPDLLGGEGEIPYEHLLAGAARGREAIDLAIGEGLRALEDRDAFMALGYSRMVDYAREELGLPDATARSRVRLARALAGRPVLDAAVRAGRITPRKALEVLPVAAGEAEEAWVRLAEALTVRELRAAVTRAGAAAEAGPGGGPGGASGAAGRVANDAPGTTGQAGSGAPAADERWRRVALPVRLDLGAVVREALSLAGDLLGPGAPTWMRLEAIAQEFLAGRPCDPGPDEVGGPGEAGGPASPPEGRMPPAELEKALEHESRGWTWLEPLDSVASPDLRELAPDAIDARLRRLVAARAGWDETFGDLACTFVRRGMCRRLGFANLGHYVRERLGMGRRAFEQRVWLERRMEALPQLRDALARGQISYEQARLVAGVAGFSTVNAWIHRAEGSTCVQLRDAVAAERDAQMWARRRLVTRAPVRVAALLDAALRAAADAAAVPFDPAWGLAVLAWHFVQVWGPVLAPGRRARRRRERQPGWRCSTPGCSRAWVHEHHVILRSRGGADHPSNLAPVCAPHHLRGIHGGLLRVSGTAPDALRWELRSGFELGPAGRRDRAAVAASASSALDGARGGGR
jgi:hypothetical protein